MPTACRAIAVVGLLLAAQFALAPRITDAGESAGDLKGAVHLSLAAIRRGELPQVERADWVRNAIDRFVLARLEREEIAPAAEADRCTLVRRVTLDLLGLPPTPAEVEAFVADDSPDAYERLVDRLLASPHYAERWARSWMDLCHYADSDGYLTDQPRPVAWRYRQWLVEALNRDLPFDRFTILQLAGDLLPRSTIDQKIATGFLRQTLSNREGGADLEEFRVEQVVDRTKLVGTVWLGLTVGCARCHDHKYDPISQEEFYQLYAFFDAADEINIDAPRPGQLEAYRPAKHRHDEKRRELLAPLAADVAKLQSRWERRLLQAAADPGRDHRWDRQWELLGLIWGGRLGEGQLEGVEIVRLGISKRTALQQRRLLDYFLAHGSIIDPPLYDKLKLGELNGRLTELRKKLPELTRAPTIHKTLNPRVAYIHEGGDFRMHGDVVRPGTPACLPPLPKHATDRLALARWLVSPRHPLTARVTVNRAWQEFFGRGLVNTSDDFGVRGERPLHGELLDWLAGDFVAHGWSLKSLHRRIVTSATYRQSSRARPALLVRDPSNRLLARQTPLRLSAEAVRDTALAVSGLLSPKIGGPSVRPPQPASVTAEGFGESTWKVSPGEDRYRRGLYTWLQRTSPFAQSTTFDAPSPSRSCTRRRRSNTPLQALTLLNDPVFFEAAQQLAVRVLREGPGDTAGRIEYVFGVCMARKPNEQERQRLTVFLQQQSTILRNDPQAAAKMFPDKIQGVDSTEAAAWTGLASVLLNLHEFITRD
ncbi:MAG: DUF1553 domain-containing protein [Planctomycetes bacterium]|nr:DUF1553 domain-containing protein [Planctomycetota bacterium]